MTKLNRLYKKTKTGATQIYDISYEGNQFFVKFGQLNGKMQIETTKCYPKNVGRSNETSGSEQAKKEAIAKHEKKIKSGYSENEDCRSEVMLPMKVKSYAGNESKITIPCVSTEKLNGVNGEFVLENGRLKLMSRGGTEFPRIPHLENPIRNIMEFLSETRLNVELYIPGAHLQDITSAVKKPKESSKEIIAYIFDISSSGAKFEQRRASMFNAKQNKLEDNWKVDFIIGEMCLSKEEIEEHYEKTMEKGLEGTVIKNLDGLYIHNIRSSDQYKYKKAKDAEFEVVSFNLDKHGHPVYQCRTREGEPFSVKRKGTAQERLLDSENAESNIGKWLNIEFEMYSKPSEGNLLGVPLKPVGLDFRDCDLHGNPVI